MKSIGKTLVTAMIWVMLALPSSADQNDALTGLWHCVGQKTPERLLNGVRLRPFRIVLLEKPYAFVEGALGYHLTWGVLFRVSKDGLIAYETYGAKGDITGAFGRMPVPRILRRAIIECGAEWKGLWPDEWPERRPIGGAPVAGPTWPIWERPIEDLMPPRQQP
ncbi:MAG: hypothetical protein ABJ360_21235 [Roseobacter sp.]